MLDPNQRSLLTSLLTPPPGMTFDTGVATTYTLDPLTLLGVPLHLAWLAAEGDRSVFADTIRLLESLQRVSSQLTVFADRGRMHVPAQPNALYALLERTIVEVKAPLGGAFHPKLWALRFVRDGSEDVVLRLAIMSRNLTSDRAWDLSLVLEGQPRGAIVAANRSLGEFIANLPAWAVGEVSARRRAQVDLIASDIRRTKWGLPGKWEEVKFHVIGIKAGNWRPIDSDELIVISPFLKLEALSQLQKTTKKAMAIVSRPDTFASLPAEVRGSFERCMVLDEAAETDDGEDLTNRGAVGLHAKAILLRKSWMTHLYVGSANATNAAMVAGTNVEVIAELVGRHSQVGRVEDLLAQSDLGSILTAFDSLVAADVSEAAQAQAKAEAALELCQQRIAQSACWVVCERTGDGDWRLVLRVGGPVEFADVGVVAWPVSLEAHRKVDAKGLTAGMPVTLGVLDAADVTGLIGFELSCDGYERRFALNLKVQGLPEDRDAAILRRIVRNREGFLRYLRLLLGGLVPTPTRPDGGNLVLGASWQTSAGDFDSILEGMVRAWSREPERLESVKRVVDRLRGFEGDDGQVIPAEFDGLWAVFAQALGAVK